MAVFRTKTCGRFGHPEFKIILDDAFQMEPHWVLDFFQNAVATGTRFKPTETVQIGWMLTKLFETDEGDLEVREPRFQSIPIQWVPGINNTLRHLILQKSIAELIPAEPAFPSILQAGIVAPLFWEQLGLFQMFREAPANNDSGWRISGREKEQADGQFHSLFEIGCKAPLLIPFLALPPSASVERNIHGIKLIFRDKTVSSEQSALLRDLEKTGVIWN